MQTPYVYVLIREDLTPEQQMVQAAHAALEAGFRFQPPSGDVAHLALLSVPDESHLQRAAAELAFRGIDHHLFYEPDFGPMGHSALATRPLYGGERKWLKKYPLFRAGCSLISNKSD